MATQTINVSGISALRWILTGNDTFYFTNAVDGQKLLVTFQQPPSGTGPYTPVSGNCPGLIGISQVSSDDTTIALVYDSTNNTWNGLPNQFSPASFVVSSTTTTSSIAWTRGLFLVTASAAVTLTVTNPVSGPPGVGNDGEVMLFVGQAAHAIKLTMGTTSTMNGTSTSIVNDGGTAGQSYALLANAGKVYLQSVVASTYTLS